VVVGSDVFYHQGETFVKGLFRVGDEHVLIRENEFV
jgi:hypothetical protein